MEPTHKPSTVRVSRKGADRVLSGHPWIFASDVTDRGGAAGGDAVAVADPRGRLLGTAHYSDASQICLRLLSREVEPVDAAFWRKRLEAALEFRRRVVRETDAFRLVHGEADLLPGLIVDRYGDILSLQTLTQGMDRAKPVLVECLRELLSPTAGVARNDVAVRERERLPVASEILWGELPAEICITMNGVRFWVDALHGQKTGAYLDQRENYLAAARYASGQALDCFTSGGGFALHLASVCGQVEAVDSSETALHLAARNAEANGLANIAFREANVFDLLNGYAAAGRQFDTIVLDPPAFAKSRSNLEAAERGYKEINYRALRLLAPGGVLVTCSCSHHLNEAMLLQIVASAALDAGRPLRVLERRTQAADHPILLTVPETLYLKCLIFQAL